MKVTAAAVEELEGLNAYNDQLHKFASFVEILVLTSIIACA